MDYLTAINMKYLESDENMGDRVVNTAHVAILPSLNVPETLVSPNEQFNPGTTYAFTQEGNKLKLTGIKKYVITEFTTGNPVAFDAVKVTLTIDLTKFDWTKLVKDQGPGCVTETYTQLGRTTNWNNAHF